MTSPENIAAPGEITVFYDGGCPLCRREIAHYQGMRGAERVQWIDITEHRQRLKDYGIRYDQAMARFHVLDAEGAWQTGAYGFVELWMRLPALRWLAMTLQQLRLLPVIDWAYGHFARRRLKSRCKDSVCT